MEIEQPKEYEIFYKQNFSQIDYHHASSGYIAKLEELKNFRDDSKSVIIYMQKDYAEKAEVPKNQLIVSSPFVQLNHFHRKRLRGYRNTKRKNLS